MDGTSRSNPGLPLSPVVTPRHAFSARPSSTQSIDLRIVTLQQALGLQRRPSAALTSRRPSNTGTSQGPTPKALRHPRPPTSSATPRSTTTQAAASIPLVDHASDSGCRAPAPRPPAGLQLAALAAKSQDASRKALTASGTSVKNKEALSLSHWPATLPPTPPSASTARRKQETAVEIDATIASAALDVLSKRCAGHRDVLRFTLGVVTNAEGTVKEAAESALATFTAPATGLLFKTVQEAVVDPMVDLRQMWSDVAQSTEATATALVAQNAKLKADIREFMLKEASGVDELVSACEAENPALRASVRRYGIIHDRQAALASQAAGLHEARIRLDSMQKANRQILSECHSNQVALSSEHQRSERVITQGEGRLRTRLAATAALEDRLLSSCRDLDYAREQESSLRFRIESERQRRDDILKDISGWRAKLDAGDIAQNTALTPRPQWLSLDPAPWGISLRPAHPSLPSSPSDATPSAEALGASGTPLSPLLTLEKSTANDRERFLGCRDSGGAGYASPIAMSTSAALTIISDKLRAQQRIARALSDYAATFRRMCSTFLSNMAPVVFTFATANLTSLVQAKPELVCNRGADNLNAPAAMWNQRRLAAVCYNLACAVARRLGRSAADDDAVVALGEFVESSEIGHNGSEGVGPPGRSRSNSNASRRPSVALPSTSLEPQALGVGGSPEPAGSRFRAVGRRVRLAVGALPMSTTHLPIRDALDELLDDWPVTGGALMLLATPKGRGIPPRPTAPSAHSDYLGRGHPDLDTVGHLVNHVRSQASKATVDGNPLAFALAEALQGHQSLRLFTHVAAALDGAAKLFATLLPQENNRPPRLPLLLVEALVRKACIDCNFGPGFAARIAIAAARGGRCKVDVAFPELTYSLASSVMLHLLDEQRRLFSLLTRVVAATSYHAPVPAGGIAGQVTTTPTVWLYPAELRALLLVLGGLPLPRTELPDILAEAEIVKAAAELAAGASAPAPPIGPRHARPALRVTAGLLLEHLTCQAEQTESIANVYPKALPSKLAPQGTMSVSADSRGRRRTEFNVASLRRFVHAQQGGADTGKARAAETAALSPLVDRGRGRSMFPAPLSMAVLLRDGGNPAPVVTTLADLELELYDAGDVLNRARSLCLRNYVVGAVVV
jgi:hypothetical protein